MPSKELALYQELFKEKKIQMKLENFSLTDAELKESIVSVADEIRDYLKMLPSFCPQQLGESPLKCDLPFSCRKCIQNYRKELS